MIHIHQGGTTNTYCQQPLTLPGNVSWEQASLATCQPCVAAFGGAA